MLTSWNDQIPILATVMQITLLSGDHPAGPITMRITERIDRTIDLQRALEQLEPRHRALIELHYFGGLSQPEIAEMLGLTVPQVYHALKTARKQLREMLTTPPQAKAA